MPTGRDRAPRPTGMVLVLSALVGLGALATGLSLREQWQSVHHTDERAADLAASEIRGALASTIGSMRGADALAADGRVDKAEFEAFAEDLMADSLFQAIAYAAVVPEADRDAFQARTGVTIRDTDGKGGFVPAQVRPRSYVVEMLTPLSDANRAVLGFDLASDPARRAAAEESERTGLPAVSGLIKTATQAKPGIAVLNVVETPDGKAIGFLSSGLDLSVVLQRAGIDPAAFDSFGLRMDGAQLVGTSAGGATRDFDLYGRHFAVTVATGNGFNALSPTLLAIGTLVLLAAGFWAVRRDRRQLDRIALSARRSRAINELGEALAAAVDVRTVLDEVLDRGRGIMDAGHVGVALKSPDHPSRVDLRYDRSVPSDMGRRLTDTDEHLDRPFSECVREAVPVVVGDPDGIERRFPAAVEDARAAGIESLIWMPLMFGMDLCVGAVGFTWPAPMGGAILAERIEAATTVAALTSRSLERAVTAMAVQSAADNLGGLARGLASSHDAGDVQLAVEAHSARILGARDAALVLGAPEPRPDTPSDPAVIERTLENSDGVAVARLVMRWPQPTLLGPAQSAILATMVEMIGETLERTALTQQEHQVIVQLQRDLLRPPPVLPRLDVAVRYEPAMSIVGLGGDFYDVIPGEGDRIFVVIGDVTGHGSEAVATMAELKAVMQSLLGGGRSLERVCDEADRLLDRRGMYATAQIAEIDPQARRMRLVNAGHPYPLLQRADGTVELVTDGHRPLLGLPEPLATPFRSAATSLREGDALLLYTDGLIERRHQSIDIGMQSLMDIVRRHGGSGTAADLVEHVVRATHEAGDGDKTDDDMALLVVRLLG